MKQNEADKPQHSKRYRVIYADPPWDIAQKGARGASQHYDVMSLKRIKEMPIQYLADDNSTLLLWVTNAALPAGLEVMEAWGFRYITNVVWDKYYMGLGNYFRGSHEILLHGVRGKAPFKFHGQRSTLLFPRQDHSRKPEEMIPRRAVPGVVCPAASEQSQGLEHLGQRGRFRHHDPWLPGAERLRPAVHRQRRPGGMKRGWIGADHARSPHAELLLRRARERDPADPRARAPGTDLGLDCPHRGAHEWRLVGREGAPVAVAEVVRTMSTFTSDKSLRNEQRRLTSRGIEFITGFSPIGTSLRPLPTASTSEQNRREVSYVSAS